MTLINVKARVGKKLYYNQETAWGAFSFYLIDSDEKITLDKTWNNFVVTGDCPMMMEGKEYEFVMKPSWSKKYGDGYEFVEVKERKLNTIQDQQEYLRQVISKKDAEILISAYPNVMIVDYIRENKIDLTKLKGIKEGKFKKIVENVSTYENLKLALVELKDLGISMNAMKRLVNHFGNQETLINRIKENIYSLTEVELFGFTKVDEYAMKRGDDPDSIYRIKACFEHVIKTEGKDGHSWVHIDEFLQKVENLLEIETHKIVNIINQLEENPENFHIENEKVSLKLYHMYESGIKKNLDRLLKNYQKQNEFKSIEDIEEDVKLTFTSEQREAIQLAQQSGVFVLNGKAGTGKTTVLKGIIDSHFDIQYIACALSGKAANVLASKGIESSTIHRLLQVGKDGKFVYNSSNHLSHDLIVLDESSMVNSQLFYSLLQAIPNGAKVIIVGDSGQLPPIGLAAVFDDLVNTKAFPNKELTQVHRQAQKSGILTTANMIRDGEKINGRYEFKNKTFGELQDMVLIPVKDREDIFEYIVDVAKGYFEKYGESTFTDFQILTAVKNKGQNSVKNLNKELQGVFNDLDKDFLEKNGYEYRESDKVIQSGNNYSALIFPDMKTYEELKDHEKEEILEDEEMSAMVDLGSVFNGTLGRIKHINFEKKEVLIQFEDINGLVVYTNSELSMIELAYAITVHRSQGIGVKNVLATFDYVAYKLLSKQMVYTACTRASEKLVIICENGALHKAIETDLGSTRNTFLKVMLMEGVK